MMENVQALSIGGHDAILNAIMNHFHEVAGTVWPAVKVTLLGSSAHLFSSRCSRCCIDARSQGREDRVEMLDDVLLTADHQAVTTLKAPDASTRSNVNIVNAFGLKFGSTPDIIMIVRITTVNDDIAGCEMWNECF